MSLARPRYRSVTALCAGRAQMGPGRRSHRASRCRPVCLRSILCLAAGPRRVPDLL